MSGTGKSTALVELGRRGHRVVDTDTDEWHEWVTRPDGSREWMWREPTIRRLLSEHRDGALFVSGTSSNQGLFYPLLDEIVLLSAPADVMLERIARRDNNPYGKSPDERALVLEHLRTVEPLLRRGATVEIDGSAPLTEVVRRLEELA
ncbi:hypothetical protein VV02_20615 [Luteipulveratus mongoliensis]|uniref:Shikimate kinase n=2 Tax=Luteipulveratus mongoliensis TaxID=571913 RepID=A0A0K1JR07_9MICO|nr:hypothetical protein VV02_20615 [Luteipulveratus mongoliensis]